MLQLGAPGMYADYAAEGRILLLRCNNDLSSATTEDLERGEILWLQMKDLAEARMTKGKALLGSASNREVYSSLHEFFIKWPKTWAPAAPTGRVGGA